MNKYWDTVRPTYIENWPIALRNLSMSSYGIELSINQAKSLGLHIWEFGETFADYRLSKQTAMRVYVRLMNNIDFAIHSVANGVFVKLGSRSPKDRYNRNEVSDKCMNAKNAIDVLTGGSERISDDLHLAIHHNYKPYIWIREWVDMPKWAEFRCFVYKGELVGISQYFYDEHFRELSLNSSLIKAEIVYYFFNCVKPACHLDTYIFDVYAKNPLKLQLIEINPFIDLTDFCLFNDCRKEMSLPDFDKFDGGFRYVKEPITKEIDESEI